MKELVRSPLVVFLLLATLCAHAPAIQAGFLYDDWNDILDNPSARPESFFDRLPVMVRPLLKASYAVQDAVHGMNPIAFHAVNLVLHLGMVTLVFILVRRALHLAGQDGRRTDLVAATATLLWSLHPALTDTVSYVSGRSMGLSSVLALGALLAATDKEHRPILAFVLAALAPMARETALVTPLLLLAFQITVGRDLPQPVHRAAPVWIGALLAAVVLAAMPGQRELVSFSLDQRGPIDALRANLFAVPGILQLWVLPWQVSVLPSQPVVHGWADPPTLWRATALVLALGVAVAMRRKAPLAALAVLWTLLALLPTNSLIWRVDPVAVRPLYLAGIGLSLLLSVSLARHWLGLWIAVLLALALGFMTFERARLYQDEVALFTDAAAKAPMDPRAQLMLGLVLANAGRVIEAQAALERALTLDPFQTEAENALRLLDAVDQVYPKLP